MRISDTVLRGVRVGTCALVVACKGEVTAPPPPPVAIAVTAGSGQIADVGTAFAQPINVKVTDASGTGVKGVAVTFVVSAGLATVSPASAATDAQGIATATVTAGATPGQITINASAAGVTSGAIVTLTAQLALAKFAGVWNGTTSQTLPVYLRVGTGGLIDTLSVRIRATFGTSTCTGTIVKTAVPINADGTFETTVGLGFSTPFRGQFTSAAAVGGSISAYSGSFGILCGTSLIIGTGSPLSSTTWQAQKG